MSWNIGIKIDNTEKVLGFLKENQCDILAFQEALEAKNDQAFAMYRSKNDIDDQLSGEYPYSAFAPIWGAEEITKDGATHRDFGGFVEQGSLILSKYQIRDYQNQFYYSNYDKPGFDATNFEKDDHARSIQNVVFDIGGKAMRVINVHGIWNEGKVGDDRTLKQCQFIVDKALEGDLPVIIVGDFNLLPSSESIELMNKHFRNLVVENGIKSTRPVFDDGRDNGGIVCDYIFVNDKISVGMFEVVENDISDHMPLILDFELA